MATISRPSSWCRGTVNRRAGLIWRVDGRTFVTANVAAAVLFTLAVRRALLSLRAESPTAGRTPGRDLPDPASEGFDTKPRLIPFSARRASPVKSTEASIDDALIGFGSELVRGGCDAGSTFHRFRGCCSTVGLVWIPSIRVRKFYRH